MTPEGVPFRPNLLATTSFEGSVSTTYKRIITNVVCDNTMAAGLREHDQEYKVKHSARSMTRIAAARDALAIVHSAADDFAREVAELTAQKLTDAEFERLVTTEFAKPANDKPRAKTLAQKKRDTLMRLWRHDERSAPWRGTAWGAMQVLNTYQHHESGLQGTLRPERNMIRAIDGTTQAGDLDVAQLVLATV